MDPLRQILQCLPVNRKVTTGGPQDIPLSFHLHSYRLKLETVIYLEPCPVIIEELNGSFVDFEHLVPVLAKLFIGVLPVPFHVKFFTYRTAGDPARRSILPDPSKIIDNSVVCHLYHFKIINSPDTVIEDRHGD